MGKTTCDSQGFSPLFSPYIRVPIRLSFSISLPSANLCGCGEKPSASPVQAQRKTSRNSWPQIAYQISSLRLLSSSHYLTCEGDTRTRLVQSLAGWNFEPHKLPEEQVLACSYILFEALFRIEGMQDAVGLSLSNYISLYHIHSILTTTIPLTEQVAAFLHQLQQIYRRSNTYHNFEHALDVFQATYHFLSLAQVVPPVSILSRQDSRWRKQDTEPNGLQQESLIDCLTHEDIFALCIAAVGHDVGHPGLTNAFMVSIYAFFDAYMHSSQSLSTSLTPECLEKRQNAACRTL